MNDFVASYSDSTALVAAGNRVDAERKASPEVINDHAFCLLCGKLNPWSLRLSFIADGNGGVKTQFTATAVLQGYDGILHGGVTAALLDSAMTHCLFHQGIVALTADLHVRYIHAISCCACLEISALMLKCSPPLYRLRAEISQDGILMAWSEAKFLRRPSEA